MAVPIPTPAGRVGAAGGRPTRVVGGLQAEEMPIPRAHSTGGLSRSWSGRRTTLLVNSPSAGGTVGPLFSPSFSGHGFIRQSPSVASASPALSPPPLDLHSSMPTIYSVENLAAVASATTNVPARMSGLISPSPSPRGSVSSSLATDLAPEPVVNQSLEVPLMPNEMGKEHQVDTLEQVTTNGDGSEGGNGLLKCAIFGAINAVVAVPCMIAYAAIIFAHPFFTPFKGQLVKLVLFSSLIHQACFSAKSSLPFAIGQVQDAGLIFLSQMAKSLVASCKAASLPDDEIIATTLVGLGCCTAALGAALWTTGRLQLADAVQYLPLPVIGGYLAFIGLYCFEAALSLMTGLEVTGLLSLDDARTEWEKLATLRNLWLTLPGILCGVALLVMVLRVRHYLALPLSLVAIPVGFYVVLLSSELDLEHLADTNSTPGWIAPLPTETPPPFYDVWKLFQSR